MNRVKKESAVRKTAVVAFIGVLVGLAFGTANSQSAPTDYELAVHQAQRRAAQAVAASEDAPRLWSRKAAVAKRYLDWAMLTGDLDLYERARRWSEDAARVAGSTPLPLMLRARTRQGVHRFREAGGDLQRIGAIYRDQPGVEAQRLSMLGDVAMQSGHFVVAAREYERALRTDRNFSVLSRVAYFALSTGDDARADELYEEAASRLRTDETRRRSWLALQRGVVDLERGRLRQALAHYRVADAYFSGWWLVEEHLAEVLAKLGEVDEAVARYRNVVEKTQKPDLMDALAQFLNGDQRRQLQLRARALHEAQLERSRSWIGHVVDHYLASGDDANRALQLATQAYEDNAGAVSATQLAEARLANGDGRGALNVLQPLLRTPWRSARTYRAAAEAACALGDLHSARDYGAAALGLNPTMEPLACSLGELP